jgi:hypothetical protein
MSQTALQMEEDFDAVYNKIASLYDHAENILKAAYHESVTNHELFLAEIEPLVEQIEKSANTLAEDFSDIIESGKSPSNAMKIRVSSALRKILLQIEEFKAKVEQLKTTGE